MIRNWDPQWATQNASRQFRKKRQDERHELQPLGTVAEAATPSVTKRRTLVSPPTISIRYPGGNLTLLGVRRGRSVERASKILALGTVGTLTTNAGSPLISSTGGDVFELVSRTTTENHRRQDDATGCCDSRDCFRFRARRVLCFWLARGSLCLGDFNCRRAVRTFLRAIRSATVDQAFKKP